MRRIDLKVILQDTVSGGYGDLVTRPTGKAVRGGIERELADLDGGHTAVIDFGAVRCLDISCADEIVGKLLLHHGQARYFLLQGVTASHCDAIEHVLERHRLAVAARDRQGKITVLGPVDDTARRAFTVLSARGPAGTDEVADELSLPPDRAQAALETLRLQRLVHHAANRYMAVTA
jgi:hypothetical protein